MTITALAAAFVLLPGIARPDAPASPALVPAGKGTFLCGGNPYALPAHRVELTRSFAIGRCEVTNAEYAAALQWARDRGYVRAESTAVYDVPSGCLLVELNGPFGEIGLSDGRFEVHLPRAPWVLEDDPKYDPSRVPVHGVTWYGAAAFCNWISEAARLDPPYDSRRGWAPRNNDPYVPDCYRLPTEAEWEFAARGPSSLRYPWGEEPLNPQDPRAETCNTNRRWPVAVGSFSPAGDSSFGATDMIGNVWEWTYDRKAPYTDAPLIDPGGPVQGRYRMIRGGSYYGGMWTFETAIRAYCPETNAQPYIGFRVARTTGE